MGSLNQSDKTSKSSHLFATENSFEVQTVRYFITGDLTELADNDTIDITYDGNTNSTLSWPFTVDELEIELASVSAPANVQNLTASGFVATLTGDGPFGLLEIASDGPDLCEVSLRNTRDSSDEAFESSITMFAFDNGTNQDIEITYEGSFDNTIWFIIGSTTADASLNPGILADHGRVRDSIVEPWPWVRITAIPAGPINIAEDELFSAWWGAKA